MSRLIIEENPLMLLPSLAKEIGLHEAIIIQQLHYWLTHKNPNGKMFGRVADGERWIRNTVKEWQKSNFTFLSESQIYRAIKSLEDQGLIKSRNDLNKIGYDRTKWYTIDRAILHEREMDFAQAQNGFHASEDTIPEITTEITTETTSAKAETSLFLEELNARKPTPKPKEERKPIQLKGIESAIMADRKVTEEDRAETAGETIDSRLSGWRDDSVLIIVRAFAEAFGKLPPAAPTHKKEKAPYYYAWREGAEKLLNTEGQGDLKHIIKLIASEYDGGYSAINPGSIAQMVYDKMNEIKKKEKTRREHKPFEFD